MYLHRVLLECLVHKVTKVNKVSLAWKVFRVLKVTKETLVHKVQEDPRAIEEKWECQGFLESMVFLACKDHKDL